jgi:hypothetical protein
MSKSIHELADSQLTAQLTEAYGQASGPEELKKQAEKFSRTEKMLRELMRPGGNTKTTTPSIDLSEAVHAADFKILFPKVVQDVLQRPKEPTYIGQSLLARTIQVDGAKIMEFPTLGAIRAFELADTQEPPEQDPSFSRNITEIRVRRFGLKLEMTNEVIEESQWDILSLYTEAAGAAMMRLKEELIFREYEDSSVVLFDNEVSGKHTTGTGTDGETENGTFDHMDLLDMMAALGANGYNPSHLVLHPLAWAVWAKDPVLRFQLLHRGGIGQNLVSPDGGGVDQNANAYVPFGLNVVVTPFQTVTYNDTLTGSLSGQAAANTTSITLVDNNNSILVMQRSPMSIVSFENPMRDIRTLCFHEKYGLATLDAGRSTVIAKNVRIALNEKPVYTVKSITPA